MKINARETAQRNGRDGGRSTRMGVTAGLPSARARIDERMTCAKDRKHTSCRLVRRRWRGRAAYTCSAKKAHRQNDAMGHTSAQGTSHIWCPRTATPAGDANGGSMPCSGERRRAKPTHIHGCSVSNNTHTHTHTHTHAHTLEHTPPSQLPQSRLFTTLKQPSE